MRKRIKIPFILIFIICIICLVLKCIFLIKDDSAILNELKTESTEDIQEGILDEEVANNININEEKNNQIAKEKITEMKEKTTEDTGIPSDITTYYNFSDYDSYQINYSFSEITEKETINRTNSCYRVDNLNDIKEYHIYDMYKDYNTEDGYIISQNAYISKNDSSYQKIDVSKIDIYSELQFTSLSNLIDYAESRFGKNCIYPRDEHEIHDDINCYVFEIDIPENMSNFTSASIFVGIDQPYIDFVITGANDKNSEVKTESETHITLNTVNKVIIDIPKDLQEAEE